MVFSLCFPLAEVDNVNRSFYTPVPSNVEPWKPIRYETLTYTSAPDSMYTSYHRLNQYGFRDDDWSLAKPTGKKRVLFVGDSFVEGAMCDVERSIPQSFAASAGAEMVQVMNAGISGAGLPEYAQLMHALIPTFRPDAVILVLFANDIGQRQARIPTDEFVPRRSNRFLPRVVHVISRLADGQSPGFRWGPHRPLNPAVPDPANHWSLLYDQYAPHVDPALVKHMQAGHFNIWRINYLKFEEVNLKRPAMLDAFFQQLKTYTDKYTTELMVCYIPSRNQITRHYLPYDLLSCQILCSDSMDLTQEPYQIHRRYLDTICQQNHIPFLDLTGFLQANEKRGQHMYWQYDDHFRPQTYRLAGQVMYDFYHSKMVSQLP